MDGLVIWAGFLGAWLLVGGPVHQAVLENRRKDRLNQSFVDRPSDEDQLMLAPGDAVGMSRRYRRARERRP